VKFTAVGEIYGTTQLIPLGILISTYVFFVVTGTGLSIIVFFGHIFKIRSFELVSKRAVFLAIITLLCGFGAIGLEVERPLRLLAYNFTSPQFSAPIWRMGLFYSLCLPLLLCEFGFMLKNKVKTARVFGLGAFLAEVAAAWTLGAVFGVIERPYWHGTHVSINLIVSGISSGAAFLICFTAITCHFKGDELSQELRTLLIDMGKGLAVFVGATLIVLGWKIIMSLISHTPQEYYAVMAMLKGPLSFNFWIFEILIGSVVPMFLLTFSRTRTVRKVVLAAACVIVGMFVSRYNMVIVGQIHPVWRGDYALYSPNYIEWFVVIACIGACLLFYTLGVRFFSLNKAS
jgi:Ni/Fe-hydrogenase subunit HybB-like protein